MVTKGHKKINLLLQQAVLWIEDTVAVIIVTIKIQTIVLSVNQ